MLEAPGQVGGDRLSVVGPRHGRERVRNRRAGEDNSGCVEDGERRREIGVGVDLPRLRLSALERLVQRPAVVEVERRRVAPRPQVGRDHDVELEEAMRVVPRRVRDRQAQPSQPPVLVRRARPRERGDHVHIAVRPVAAERRRAVQVEADEVAAVDLLEAGGERLERRLGDLHAVAAVSAFLSQ